jgi:hypothetical protein
MKRIQTLLLILLTAPAAMAQESLEGLHNVRDHGAKGNGKRDNTGELQDAIDLCAEEGGYVWVPPGTYLTGTLKVKSGVELRLGKGAVLKFTNNGHNDALLVLDSVEDVNISGSGKLVSGGALSILVTKSQNIKIEGLRSGIIRLAKSSSCFLHDLHINQLATDSVVNCHIASCHLYGAYDQPERQLRGEYWHRCADQQRQGHGKRY